MICTVKGFGVVNKAEVNVFLEYFCFSMIQQMLAIRSLVPLPFLNPAWTSGSSWLMYCWSLTWRILENEPIKKFYTQSCMFGVIFICNIIWHVKCLRKTERTKWIGEMRQTEFGSARNMCLAHKMLEISGLDRGLSRRESLVRKWCQATVLMPTLATPRTVRENVAKQDGEGEPTTTTTKALSFDFQWRGPNSRNRNGWINSLAQCITVQSLQRIRPTWPVTEEC